MQRNLYLKFLLLPLFACLITGQYSCKSKTSTPGTKVDSASITKFMTASKTEKIHLLKLSALLQTRIFLNNNVKQIHFTWHSYPANTWGLDAFGADENGKAVPGAGPYELEPVASPIPNYQYLDRIPLMTMQRGDIKNMLNLPTLGRDVEITPALFKDLLFTPTQYPYPDTPNSMYFEVTLYPSIPLVHGKMIASQQSYIKPSPPALPECATCDEISK